MFRFPHHAGSAKFRTMCCAPVFDKSRVSYIPVENHQVKLRELFTREEAEALQGTEEMKKDEKLRQAVEYVLGKKEDRMAQQQPQQAIHKFVLGNKELEGKTAEFQYDKGWYSITDIVGEERNVIYKSRNAQEAYMKWNVYIGRKKKDRHPAKTAMRIMEAVRMETEQTIPVSIGAVISAKSVT